MATTSSDSSRARRQQLCAEYVNLPTVYSHIRIESYIKLAYSFYNEGLALFESKYYVRSYIEFKKFTELSVAHLAQHKSYELIKDERSKLMVYLKIAVAQLQKIARILDEEEDEKLRNKEILDLVDAFDEKDEEEMMDRLQQNFTALNSAPPTYDFSEKNRTSPRNIDQFSHEEKMTVDRFSEKSKLDVKDDLPHIWNFENKEDLLPGNRKTFEECVRTLRYPEVEKEEEKSPYYQFIPEFVPLGEIVRETEVDEEEEISDLSVQNRYYIYPFSSSFAFSYRYCVAIKVLAHWSLIFSGRERNWMTLLNFVEFYP
jgi:hypothetical protein